MSELSDRKVKETDPNIMEEAYIRDEKDFQPWLRASEVEAREQQVFQDILRRRAGAVSLGSNCYISPAAHVLTTRFWLGENSWIAAGAIVRGHVAIGANSSINPSAHIAGKVVIGDGVRIAGLASIYGFNHGFDRTDVPIYQQAHTSKGVKIGNGTWIGASAVIIDGVTVGDHCIIAAGAVCTKDVPEYSIVAGNPAKIVRNRKEKYANIMVTSENVSLVRKILYSENPFQDLPFSYPLDLQGWDSENPIFCKTIESVRPKLIVEVGAWKGASALHMATLCRRYGLQTEIVCVDTWLGNWQHWSRGGGGIGTRDDLKIVNGFPRLYYQFMSNVIHAGYSDMITPLPLTGIAGAKLFEHYNISADIIYIDGDHEYESVLFDLRLWMKRLTPTGTLIGNDYNWPTVKQAADEVAASENLILSPCGQKFTLKHVN